MEDPSDVIRTLNDIGIWKDPATCEYNLDLFPPERTIWTADKKGDTYTKICSLPNGEYVWQSCVSTDMYSFFDRMSLLDIQPARVVVTPDGCKMVSEFDDTRLRAHPLVRALCNMYEMAQARILQKTAPLDVSTWFEKRYQTTESMLDSVDAHEILNAYRNDTGDRNMSEFAFWQEVDAAHGHKRMLQHDDKMVYAYLIRRDSPPRITTGIELAAALTEQKEKKLARQKAYRDDPANKAKIASAHKDYYKAQKEAVDAQAYRNRIEKDRLASEADPTFKVTRRSPKAAARHGVLVEAAAPIVLTLPAVKAPKKEPKQKIPAALKKLVWNKHVGGHVGEAKCVCCKVTPISQMSFNCGHVVAEKNGGKLELPNLRPICQNCNSSMGTRNMDEFIDMYKLHD